jgi:O-antigen/teichoic acid export membrane protein
MASVSFRKLVEGTFVYTLLGFLPLAARLVLFPVFVRYLTPYDYGLISLTNTLTSALTIVAVFGLEAAFGLYYFTYRRTPKMLATYFSTILTSMLGIGAVLVGVGWLLGPMTVRALFKDPAFSYYPYGQIAVVVAVTGAVNALVLSYYRNSQQPRKFFLVAITSFAISLVAEAVAIIGMKQGAEGVLIARLLGAGVVAVAVIGYVYGTTGLAFSRKMLWRSLAYSTPVLIYLFFGFVYNSYDRILIENYLSVAQVAVFSTAFTIASVLEIFMQAVQSATYPSVFELLKHDPKAHAQRVNQLFRMIGWGMLVLAAAILAPTPAFITYVTRPEYEPAVQLVPWLLVGFLFRFFYIVWTTPLFFYARYTKQLPWLNIVCGVAIVGFNIALLPWLGLLGAAIAMVLARGIQLMITAALYYRQHELRIDLGVLPIAYGVGCMSLLSLSLASLVPGVVRHVSFALPLGLSVAAALGVAVWLHRTPGGLSLPRLRALL